jgi:GT2 family glycosyltransferase
MSVLSGFVQAHVTTQLEFGPALVNCRFDWQVEASSKPFQRWYSQRVAEWTGFRLEDAKQIADDVFEITSVLATTANLSVSRADFDKVGGFDAGYPFGCEDQDFAGRMARDGIRALATKKSIATHVETHNSLRRICQRQRLGAMDTVRFIRRFAVEYHCGEQTIAGINGPVRWGADPLSLIAKKITRQLITWRALSPIAFGVVYVVERIMPQ